MKDQVASIQAKLLSISRAGNKNHQLTLTRYFQERLLFRLSRSEYFHADERRQKQWTAFLRKAKLNEGLEFLLVMKVIAKDLQPIYERLQ